MGHTAGGYVRSRTVVAPAEFVFAGIAVFTLCSGLQVLPGFALVPPIRPAITNEVALCASVQCLGNLMHCTPLFGHVSQHPFQLKGET